MQFGKRSWVKAAAAMGALIGLGLAQVGSVQAQQPPIKIGFAIAQTGPLGGGGKASLLGFQIWAEEVNARGGLLGRQVQLITYDDQSNPATVPGIYSKLLDIDKVDLIIAPYGTNQTAPIMPLVKQRDLLLIGNFSFDVNAQLKHDKWFNNSPWGSGAVGWGGTFLDAAKKLGAKTIAFMAADAEFSQNLATGSRAISKAIGLQTVYDQNYPPNTVDFSSMIRAVRAAKPDVVFIASYPAESAALVRAINEIGVGNSVKLLGGGMVGLQFTPIMEALGPMLNGIVNYNSWVPEKTMNFPGIKEFITKYQSRAEKEKVDPLGVNAFGCSRA
jgi:branched-chain amino acid transport system substrate-binding protein